MTDLDKKVVEEFYQGQDKIPHGKLNKTHIEKMPELKDYLYNRYHDSSSYYETVYRIKNGLETRPVCKTCGNPVKFLKGRFLQYCSHKCSAVNLQTKEVRKTTCQEKYGVENVAQLDSVQLKIKNTCKEKFGVENAAQSEIIKEKVRNTCTERYGKSSYLETDECKEATKNYCNSYGVDYISQIPEIKEKIKKTCKEKYGVENAAQSEIIKEKIKTTFLKKYGVTCPTLLPEVQEKIREKNREKYGSDFYLSSEEGKQRTKETLLKKYGVDHFSKTGEFRTKIKESSIKRYEVEHLFRSDEVKKKIRESMISRYGVWYSATSEHKEKVKTTSYEKYGIDNYAKSDVFKDHMKSLYPEVQEKSKQTCLKKYGVENYSQTSEFRERTNATKAKNNSFNQSKPEEHCYEFLQEIYPDVIRQYSSNEYPFACDFYIPSENLYVELNAHWTHGKHPFDPTNPDDLNKLKNWKTKNTDFYKNAIMVWTVHDPKKRKFAEENNLNYLEFWDEDQFFIYFNKKRESTN